MIEIKSVSDIECMRAAGKLAARTLQLVKEKLRVGMSTKDIDDIVVEFTKSNGAIAAPLGYRGSDNSYPPFPASCCTSVNDVACHGIPGGYRLKDGDIVNVDVTSILDGFHGDTSATFLIGNCSKEAQRVTEVAENALLAGIRAVKPGARVGDIGAAIQSIIEGEGFSVVRDYVGHGIGRKFHDDPKIFHFGIPGTGVRLQPGMTFTIEPMVNAGTRLVVVDSDEWTVRTRDGRLSAQFEHSVLVTDDGVEVLTKI